MDMNDLSEAIADKLMYRIGEMTVTLGLFITAVGAVLMLYNNNVPMKKDIEMG